MTNLEGLDPLVEIGGMSADVDHIANTQRTGLEVVGSQPTGGCNSGIVTSHALAAMRWCDVVIGGLDTLRQTQRTLWPASPLTSGSRAASAAVLQESVLRSRWKPRPPQTVRLAQNRSRRCANHDHLIDNADTLLRRRLRGHGRRCRCYGRRRRAGWRRLDRGLCGRSGFLG
jgi:hypothetical protein